MLVPRAWPTQRWQAHALVTGIYASLIPALVAVLFNSSTRLGVGPTALTSLLIGASLTGLAEPGSAQWVAWPRGWPCCRGCANGDGYRALAGCSTS